MRRSNPIRLAALPSHAFPFWIGVHSILSSKEKVLVLSRKLKAGAVGVVAAVVLFGVGVSSASAVPAVWNSTGQAKVTGSLTVTNGVQTTVCSLNPATGYSATNSGSPLQARFGGDGTAVHGCANGGLLGLRWGATGAKSGTAFSLTTTVGGSGLTRNPFGSPGFNEYYTATGYTVPFANGTVSTSSTVSYNNTQLGTIGGASLLATGTLTFTKVDGSLLKLQ